MDIIKQEYEDYWNVSEVEREICREKLRQQLPMLRGAVGASQVDIANAIGISRQTYNAIARAGRSVVYVPLA